jgi:hypothetical protein
LTKGVEDLTDAPNAPEWFRKLKAQYPGARLGRILDEALAEQAFWEAVIERRAPGADDDDDDER